MIVHEVQQNSGDWWSLKIGKPSASSIDKIIKAEPTWFCISCDGDASATSRHTSERTAQAAADKQNKKVPGSFGSASMFEPSSAAEKLSDKLIAEWRLQSPVDDYQSYWMERGHELEQECRLQFQFQRDLDIVPGGFVTTDDGRLGCSPDGRVYDGGKLVSGCELKNPAPQTHVGYYRRPETLVIDYKQQVQTTMYVCEVGHWWMMSYHPSMEPVIVRVERDDAYIGLIAAAVTEFCDQLDAAKAELLARGFGPKESA